MNKLKFDLKDRFDLLIIITGIILLISGAFLRFFKYLLYPTLIEKLSYFLGFEFILFLILLFIKIWRI
jgi:hypothetical protein